MNKPANLYVELTGRLGKTETYTNVHRVAEEDSGRVIVVEYRVSGGFKEEVYDALDWDITHCQQEE